MRELVDVLITGFTIGIVYFLVAVGFTLCYGVGRVLNYSYGSFFTWGAYLAWVIAVGYARLNYFLVFLIVLPIAFLMGLVVDRVIIRPLRSRPEFDFSVLLATLGLAVFLDNLVLVIFGARTKSLPKFLEGSVSIAGFTLSWQLIAMFIFAAVVAVALFVLMAKTRTGMSMRAVAQDPTGARIVGIPLFRVYAIGRINSCVADTDSDFAAYVGKPVQNVSLCDLRSTAFCHERRSIRVSCAKYGSKLFATVTG